MLGDIDRQQSVRSWLQRRPAASPPITTWAVDNGKVFRAPKGTTHVVLDTPGALYDYEQSKLLVWLDAMVIPIGPSLFDREASFAFLSELRRHPRVSSGKCKIAVIGMRWPKEVVENWRSGLGNWEQTLLTVIPEDPRYRTYLETGSSVFDEYGPQTPQDLIHWSPLLRWLDTIWSEARVTTEHNIRAAKQDHSTPTQTSTIVTRSVSSQHQDNAAMFDPNGNGERVTSATQTDSTHQKEIPGFLLKKPTTDPQPSHGNGVSASINAGGESVLNIHSSGTVMASSVTGNEMTQEPHTDIYADESSTQDRASETLANDPSITRSSYATVLAPSNERLEEGLTSNQTFSAVLAPLPQAEDTNSRQSIASKEPDNACMPSHMTDTEKKATSQKQKGWLSRWFKPA